MSNPHLLRETYYGGFEGGSEEGPWTPMFKKYGYPASAIKTDFEKLCKNY